MFALACVVLLLKYLVASYLSSSNLLQRLSRYQCLLAACNNNNNNNKEGSHVPIISYDNIRMHTLYVGYIALLSYVHVYVYKCVSEPAIYRKTVRFV